MKPGGPITLNQAVAKAAALTRAQVICAASGALQDEGPQLKRRQRQRAQATFNRRDRQPAGWRLAVDADADARVGRPPQPPPRTATRPIRQVAMATTATTTGFTPHSSASACGMLP